MSKSMAVVFRLVCVRHGETNFNKEKRFQGALNVPLNEKGLNQAKKAGVALKTTKFTRAYASDLIRAHVTCQVVLRENLHPLLNIITEPAIRERNFGAIEGEVYFDVVHIIKAANKTWETYTAEGAENLGQVQERVVGFFKKLCQSVYDSSHNSGNLVTEDLPNFENHEPSQSILVVSHGAALKQLFVHFLRNLNCRGHIDESCLDSLPPNTGISEFVIKYSPRKYETFCIRFGEASHLEGEIE